MTPIKLGESMIIEAKGALEHAEQLLDNLARDADLRQQFAASPAQVLVRYNLAQDTSQEALDTANRIFFSIVTNRELVRWVREHEPAPETTEAARLAVRRWAQGTAELSIPDADKTRSVEEILSHEQFLNGLVHRLASDPAVSAALPAGLGAPEMQHWVNDTMAALRDAKSFDDLPKPKGPDYELDMWGVILIILVVVAVLAIAVVVDANDGMVAASAEDRQYALVNNLYEFSQALSQLPRS